jgi:hypothetical protein
VATAFVFLQCTPDFDSLSAGQADGGEGAASGAAADVGGEHSGGAESGGEPAGGSMNAGLGGDGGVAGVETGGAPSMPTGGAGGQTEDGGAGGGGGSDSCPLAPLGATTYVTFDTGLEGPGFVDAITDCTAESTKGGLCSSEWDPSVGSSCPGALHIVASFQDYASGAEPHESVHGGLYFDDADWSSATALHATVKVAPTSAPLDGIRFFVISGNNYRYTSIFDGQTFENGAWNEMTLKLVAGAEFDPTEVKQLGVQVVLKRADASGIPAEPPTVDVWLDDVWLED